MICVEALGLAWTNASSVAMEFLEPGEGPKLEKSRTAIPGGTLT